MALGDYAGEPVVGGTWLYDGVHPRRIVVIACDYDKDYASRQDDLHYMTDSERLDLAGEIDTPVPLGPDERLYYIKDTSSPGHRTVAEAKAWADSQPWGPVRWDK